MWRDGLLVLAMTLGPYRADCQVALELEPACGGQIGMDYGGNPMGSDGRSCGYAPVIAIVADDSNWAPPVWYNGPVITDTTMTSPLECQVRCFAEAECGFFSYEYEMNGKAS